MPQRQLVHAVLSPVLRPYWAWQMPCRPPDRSAPPSDDVQKATRRNYHGVGTPVRVYPTSRLFVPYNGAPAGECLPVANSPNSGAYFPPDPGRETTDYAHTPRHRSNAQTVLGCEDAGSPTTDPAYPPDRHV